MEKTYNPHEIEQRWYQTWESDGYFAPCGEGEPYSIMIPPPNVTGSLHMGHGFNNTVMDAMTRYHRMHGRNTLWQPGTDHAGIATQMVVERQLAADNKTRHDLGRDAFIQRVWKWKEESGNNISQQLRRMGSSLDWENERFTMDEGLSNATKEVFVRLHEEGLIYRGKRLVNWDPVLHTAVSDLEVLNQEENGYLWHLRYPLADGEGFLVVATTRPETMLGDAAIAVHPGDERFKHLIGQKVKLPFTHRLIPILADDYVDPDFGTGIVKITPAHDFNDYQIWQRHRDETAIAELPHGGLINIFTISASIVDSGDENGELIPVEFHGLDRYAARKLLIEELAANGLLEKTDEHKLVVPRGDRSGAVIEPLLTDQWYVKVAPLAEPAIKAVEDGSIRFIPDNWKNTYYDWMHNIEDWCISRQIWWGHRIPAWYDEQGNVFVGRSEQEVRQKHRLADSLQLRQDEDVLDTWFSSALWPFSTLGWPENVAQVKTFYPTSVLVTGFDIIFFWVARMIMMGLKFMGDVPFRDVYIHGLIRDTQGQKMSKSKGNVLDPIDLIDGIELEALVKKRTDSLMQPHLAKTIEKATRRDFPDGIPAFGTDALRFTFAALASTGRDISFDLQRVEGYRNFCNKLWNAARYVLMNTENQDCGLSNEERALSLPDVWITSRLQETIEQVNRHTTAYRLDLAAQSIYEFTWNEYCDWYLEFSKPVLQHPQSTANELRGTRATLIGVLEVLLRLAHPIMPFITEEIWQRVAPLAGKTGASIMLESFPIQEEALIDSAAIEQMEWVKEFILGIRKIRSGMDIAPGKPLSILLQNASNNDKLWLDANRLFLQRLAKLEQIDYVDEQAPEAATALVGNMRILIPLAGLIDKDAEIARLDKEISKIEKLVNMTTGKLSNEKFVAKAPATVVAKERTKLAGFQTSLDNLNEQRKRIRKM